MRMHGQHDRLFFAVDWGLRFDLVDRFLLERLRRGRAMSADVAWALASLQASNGARSIGALGRDLSLSRKTTHPALPCPDGLGPEDGRQGPAFRPRGGPHPRN